MHLYDVIGDASSSLRGLTSSSISFLFQKAIIHKFVLLAKIVSCKKHRLMFNPLLHEFSFPLILRDSLRLAPIIYRLVGKKFDGTPKGVYLSILT